MRKVLGSAQEQGVQLPAFSVVERSKDKYLVLKGQRQHTASSVKPQQLTSQEGHRGESCSVLIRGMLPLSLILLGNQQILQPYFGARPNPGKMQEVTEHLPVSGAIPGTKLHTTVQRSLETSPGGDSCITLQEEVKAGEVKMPVEVPELVRDRGRS